MRTALLTVGTEILFGQVVNTNAAYLSENLQNLGYDVMYHYTVGDNPGRLKELLDFAYHDCDLIITTGGLGPTQDDLTKEIIADYFGEKLVEYPDQLEILINHFKNSKYKWTENNRKQAWFPENNCTVLPNLHGTAPGFMISKNGKHIAALPGPPREMKEMFETQLKPILESHRDSVIYYRIIRTIGLGESRMETILLPLIDGQTDPTIATYAKEGECSLRVTSKRPTYEEARAACEEMIEKVNELIGEYIYSYDDEDLIDVVGKILIEKNITISAAESCTGGGFAKALTDVPGISKVFERSLVTYNWKAKQEELGVSPETLERFTAESEEVAREMVDGLKAKTGSDLCIAITGVAGPDDMDEDHPAGLAYIGINYKGETRVIRTWHKSRGRFWNRNFFVLRMFNEVYQLIK
ncbi:MAG: competence/damage-inducible protein A [Clostridiales bacterium]|nr:competence/damage-inducible protein A [Clostridiales bacterium]